MDEPFGRWLRRWDLVADGSPLSTHSSELLPVIRQGAPAMLKVAKIEEEARGAQQLAWWAGVGAAHVFAVDSDAVLLERALDSRSLVEMARHGSDSKATSIILRVASELHRPIQVAPPELVPLEEWFRSLRLAAPHRPELQVAASTAEWLLASSTEVIPLHGDLHHWNVLDFAGEWRAIDPKGLIGERTFDLVHLLRNPDGDVASGTRRLEQRIAQVAREAKVDRVRLLQWLMAFAGLSAAWSIEDGEEPVNDMAMLRATTGLLGIGSG